MDWRSKTVIVTGGAGFIGRELVRATARSGSELYILDDLSSGVREKILASNVNMVVSNVTSIGSTTSMKLENVDLIFHLGAPSSDVLFRENPIGCLKNTLVGFSEVMKFAADKG